MLHRKSNMEGVGNAEKHLESATSSTRGRQVIGIKLNSLLLDGLKTVFHLYSRESHE